MCEVTTETKICAACKKDLSITEFYFRSDKGVYRGACKKCKRIKTKEEVIKQAFADTKVCKHCGVEKSRDDFQKAGGGKWCQPYCKPCDSDRKKNHRNQNIEQSILKSKQYYQQNKEVILEKCKEYALKNKEVISRRSKIYVEKNKEHIREKSRQYNIINRNEVIRKNKERYYGNHEENLLKQKKYRENRTPEQIAKKREYDRNYKQVGKDTINAWKQKNKEKIRQRSRENARIKMSTDIQFKILKNLRSRIRIALLQYNTCKSDTTKSLLGCDIPVFRKHIESLFTEGMNWGNYGKNGWHIDHKIPCKYFDLNKPEDQKKCFSYYNMQPLWWFDNLKKGASLPESLKLQYA